LTGEEETYLCDLLAVPLIRLQDFKELLIRICFVLESALDFVDIRDGGIKLDSFVLAPSARGIASC
jgi:hypothetical protein